MGTGWRPASSRRIRVLAMGRPIAGSAGQEEGGPASGKAVTTWLSEGP